ncbi:UNVERIFIED_CONTAM: hypothetical protein FKN15_074837 [Acipenser sinensis]
MLFPSSSAKNLGVTLDPCLSYSQHISTLARTCRLFLRNIQRLQPFLTNYSSSRPWYSPASTTATPSCPGSLRPPPVHSSSSRTPLSPGVLSASLLPRYSTAPLTPLAPDHHSHPVLDSCTHLYQMS